MSSCPKQKPSCQFPDRDLIQGFHSLWAYRAHLANGSLWAALPHSFRAAGSLLRNEAQGMLEALGKRWCLHGDAKERIDREREDQGQLTKFEAASLLKQWLLRGDHLPLRSARFMFCNAFTLCCCWYWQTVQWQLLGQVQEKSLLDVPDLTWEWGKQRQTQGQIEGCFSVKMYSYIQALHCSLYICPSKQASLLPFYLCVFSLFSVLRFISIFSSNCIPFNTSSLLTTQPPSRFSMTLCPMISSFMVSSLVTNYQSAATAETGQFKAIKSL